MLGASPVDIRMVEGNQELASGMVDCMITSAVTGVENSVCDQIGFYCAICAWFPKNIVFVNAKAFDALAPVTRDVVTQAAADESTQELRRRGIQSSWIPIAFEAELKRLGDRFSREWVKSIGHEANLIFVPFYLQR